MGLTAAAAAAVLATGLAVTGAPAVSAASAPTVSVPKGGVLAQHLQTYCQHVPARIAKAEKAGPILNGSADTKGSLAFLQARVAKAKADQHPKVAQRLQRRLDRRTTLAQRLPTALPKLKQAQTECAAAGLTGASTPSATS